MKSKRKRFSGGIVIGVVLAIFCFSFLVLDAQASTEGPKGKKGEFLINKIKDFKATAADGNDSVTANWDFSFYETYLLQCQFSVKPKNPGSYISSVTIAFINLDISSHIPIGYYKISNIEKPEAKVGEAQEGILTMFYKKPAPPFKVTAYFTGIVVDSSGQESQFIFSKDISEK